MKISDVNPIKLDQIRPLIVYSDVLSRHIVVGILLHTTTQQPAYHNEPQIGIHLFGPA